MYSSETELTCLCGERICFKCGNEGHFPATCQMAEEWLNNEKSDSANLQYIKLNCEPCPKCKTQIEKNAGCQHMTCKKCLHEYCWVCKKPVAHALIGTHDKCGEP